MEEILKEYNQSLKFDEILNYLYKCKADYYMSIPVTGYIVNGEFVMNKVIEAENPQLSYINKLITIRKIELMKQFGAFESTIDELEKKRNE